MISKTFEANRLITILKNFELKKRITLFAEFFFHFITSFLFCSLIFWFFSLTLMIFNSYVLENALIFLIPVILYPIIFHYRLFISAIVKRKLLDIACEIEKKNSFKGQLISSADFIEKNYNHDKSLESRYINETLNIIENRVIPSPKIVIQTKLLIITLLAGIMFIAFSIFLNYSPAHYIKNTLFYTPFNITYSLEYKKELEKGKRFVLKIKTPINNILVRAGNSPETLINVSAKTGGSKINGWYEWEYSIKELSDDLYFTVSFYAGKQRLTTDIKKVRVFTFPTIRSIVAEYTPPLVYDLPKTVLRDTGSVEGYINGNVNLEFTFTNKLKKSLIYFHKTKKTYPMNVAGEKASFSFTLKQRDEYSVNVIDVFEHKNINPPVFSVIPVPDKPPVLTVISPDKDIVSRNTDYFSIEVEGTDDIGLKWLSVQMKKFEKEGITTPVFTKVEQINLNRIVRIRNKYKITLKNLTISPGEILKYKIKLTDIGGNSVSSKEYKITFPGLFEKLRQLDDERENIADKLNEVLENQRRLQREISTLRDKIRQGTANQEDIKKMEQLIREQTQVFNEMSSQLERTQQLRDEVANNENIRNQELAWKLDEVNKLLQEVLSKEAREALKRMQEQLHRMQNQQGVQQSNLGADMEKFIKRLERTIEMLRRLRQFQRLTNARTILATMQESLKKFMNFISQTNNTQNEAKTTSNLLEQQRQNFEQILNSVSITEFNDEIKQIIKKSKKEFKNYIEKIATNKYLSESTKLLKQEFDAVQKQLDEMIKKMSGTNIGAAKAFLDKLILEFSEISGRIDGFRKNLNIIKSGFTALKEVFHNWADDIQFIQSIINTRIIEFDNNFEGILQNKAYFLGLMRQLTDELGKSAKSLSEKDSDNAIINLSKYYEMHNGYTYLLLKIQEQLNQAMDKNNMPGEGENLNSLAEMQRQLNEQVKRMMGQVKDGKLSPQQKQYLNEMAKRQADIAKRLGNFREGNSESAKKMKQALEAIQREMEEVARELRTAKLNENLIDKQGKILKRMLDSERGLQSEERDDRRRGEQARVFRFGENEEIKKRFNEYLKNQKRFEQKKIDSLPEYYKILIKEYFDTLRNLINQ